MDTGNTAAEAYVVKEADSTVALQDNEENSDLQLDTVMGLMMVLKALDQLYEGAFSR